MAGEVPEKHYYYTRWEFITPPDPDLDVGPFHATWVSESEPKDFFSTLSVDNMKSFTFRRFMSEAEMKMYGYTVGL